MTAGFYQASNGKDQYRKLQIVTIGDLLEGKKPDLPPQDPSAFSARLRAKMTRNSSH